MSKFEQEKEELPKDKNKLLMCRKCFGVGFDKRGKPCRYCNEDYEDEVDYAGN